MNKCKQATPARAPKLIKMPANSKREVKPPPERSCTVRAPRPQTARGAPAPRAPRFQHLKLNGPVDPAFILSKHRDFLTTLEEQEISSYREIYYLRSRKPQDKSLNPVLPEKFQFVTNEHIAYRFQMLKVLGKCAFGGVIKCIDHKTGNQVAVKFLRDSPKHHQQIMYELQFLQKLQAQQGPEQHHIIKLHETFSYHGFFCFVMELGAEDVYQTLKTQNFKGFPMTVVQVVAKQGIEALAFVHKMGIMHCDFKPENVLFMSRKHSEIKLIDYGCSASSSEVIYTYIQSRFYRSPEIVMGVPYDDAIDVWSYACVLCEMVTGKPLFEAEDEQELMQLYMKIIGMPPQWMINEGKRSEYYFQEDGTPIIEPNSSGVIHKPGTSSLQKETKINDPLFISLISGCLRWDPSQRFTPEQILRHPWMHEKYGEIEHPVPFSAR